MSVALEAIKTLTITQLAGMSAAELFPLQQAASHAYQQAQATKHWVDGAIALKYQERTQSLRQQLGKETGVIHFDDEGVQVTANLPKKPEWDQAQLETIAKRMWSSGEDPSTFIDMQYRVNERTYAAWPASLKADFASARTVAVGKPSYVLSRQKEV